MGDDKYTQKDLQEAYEAWVSTSPVRYEKKDQSKIKQAIKTAYALRQKQLSLPITNGIMHDWRVVEAELREMGLGIIVDENQKACCDQEHYEEVTIGTQTIDGVTQEIKTLRLKSDEKVCARERTWRKYCNIRDYFKKQTLN